MSRGGTSKALEYYYEHHDRNKTRAREYHKRKPEVQKASKERSRAKFFGLTVEALRKLLKKTRCDLCRVKFDELGNKQHKHIDHCHKTGKVRGVLCLNCNHALGKLKDNARLFRRAADYLEGKL